MDYGEKWRTLRGIIHGLLTPKASGLFKPSQEFESKQVLWDIYSSVNNTKGGEKGREEREMSFYNHVRRHSASVMLTMIYGTRVPKWVSFTCSLD